MSVSIDDLFNAYMETAKNEIAPGTVKTHEGNFKKHIEPFFRNIDMVTVPIEAHERFIGWVKNQGLSAATTNRVRSLIGVMYSKAVKKRKFGGVFEKNPYEFIEKLRENRPEIEYWNSEEINTFLSATRETRYYPIWILMLNTGLRPGEAVALDRSQIDTMANLISINRTYCKKTDQILPRPKGRVTRYIGLQNRAVVRNTLYLILPESGFVFKNTKGGMINPDVLGQEILPRYCEKAGVKNIGLKGMRHTFASHFLMNGGTIWDLSKELGHSSVELTNK